MIVTEARIENYANRIVKLWITHREAATWQDARDANRKLQQMNQFVKRHGIDAEVSEKAGRKIKIYMNDWIAKNSDPGKVVTAA